MHKGVFIGLLQPVRIGYLIPLGVGVVDGDGALFHIVLDKLLGVHHLRGLAQSLGGKLVAVADLAVTLTPAGGNENHTVTGLGAVDSGRGAVLQHFHGLDIVGVDTGDGGGDTAIHHIQRIGVIVGGNTADTDGRSGTRSGGGGKSLHTGRLTTQSLLGAHDGTVLDVFGLHLGDGARHIGFLLHTVTHHDGFFNHLGVGKHLDGYRFGLGGHEFLGHITHGRKFNDGSGRNRNGKVTIDIGDGTVGGALLDNTGGNHRLVLVIGNHTGDRHLLLGSEGQSHKERQRKGRQLPEQRFSHAISFKWLINSVDS